MTLHFETAKQLHFDPPKLRPLLILHLVFTSRYYLFIGPIQLHNCLYSPSDNVMTEKVA